MPSSLSERAIQYRLFLERRDRCQVILPNYTPAGWHECDLWAVTKAGYMQEYEIKATVSDFRADAKKTDGRRGSYSDGRWVLCEPRLKHDRLAAGDPNGPTMFWYVVPEGMLAGETMPPWAGLIEVAVGRRGVVCMGRRNGPRLHNIKVRQLVLDHAANICYYRFWSEVERAEAARNEVDSALDCRSGG